MHMGEPSSSVVLQSQRSATPAQSQVNLRYTRSSVSFKLRRAHQGLLLTGECPLFFNTVDIRVALLFIFKIARLCMTPNLDEHELAQGHEARAHGRTQIRPPIHLIRLVPSGRS